MELFVPAKIKAHSLTGRITFRLLDDSFRAVRRNRGAAGIDRVSIKMFEANLFENLCSVMADLKDGSFEPKPLRRHYLDKGNGKLRPLGIPAVRDRVAQEVLRRLLTPIFEPLFHDASYGFRPGRNCHMALTQVLKHHEAGYQVVVDADIHGFFDNLLHRIIMQAVAAQVADGNILNLIEKFLRAGVMENGVFKPTTVGTPQGGVISPLLANIVLNHLDWQLQERGYRFVRYADDFVMGFEKAADARRMLVDLKDRLAKFGLALHEDKTRLIEFGRLPALRRQQRGERRLETFAFLGFTHYCGWTRDGRFIVKHKTQSKRLTRKLTALRQEAWRHMHAPMAEQQRWYASILRGHYGY